MEKNVALIIVFNHRYDKNIPVLEHIYEDRFSNIFFLVPFYNGKKENVIPVYENSFRFQGYMAQGFRQYWREDFEHYLFVADDLLLHPSINENNYKDHFGLDDEACFIPEIFSVHQLTNNDTLRFVPSDGYNGNSKKWYWWRLKQLIHYNHQNEGVESKFEMPSYGDAERQLKKHGYTIQPLTFEDVFGAFPSRKSRTRKLDYLRYIGRRVFKSKKAYTPSYPVVGSYSDIVIVSKGALKKFVHYCGVFAANGLFVEFAVPTALLLASDNVVTEPKLGKRGIIYWTYTAEETEAYAAFLKPYGQNLSKLMKAFPNDKLYIHPIKLSKWKFATETEKV